MKPTTGVDIARHGGWIQVFSGQPFWPLDPRPEEVAIEDIAHSLSMQCRYAGHVRYFYSVAEHSVLVSKAVPQEYALWGLLHDATEAYLQDLVQPLKVDFPEYRNYEDRLMDCIAERFGLPTPMPLAVKAIDRRMLANEKRALLNPSARPWQSEPEPIDTIVISGWEPSVARLRFMQRFTELSS